MQNWDLNTKNPIIPNFALCSLDLSYIWVQNLVTQINLTENQIFCEVEDLQRVPLKVWCLTVRRKVRLSIPSTAPDHPMIKFDFEGSHCH